MWGSPTPLVLTYLAFSAFHFYMSLHVKEYRGASQAFGVFLTLYTFVGLVFQAGFWIYYGFSHGWGTAFKLMLIVGALMVFVVFPVETWLTARLTKRGADWGPTTDLPAWLSLLGIPALPILALLMLQSSRQPARAETLSAWPSGSKAAYARRCTTDLTLHRVSKSQAITTCTCMAESLETTFGMSRYQEMMAAQPDPHGSDEDRELYRALSACISAEVSDSSAAPPLPIARSQRPVRLRSSRKHFLTSIVGPRKCAQSSSELLIRYVRDFVQKGVRDGAACAANSYLWQAV